MDKGDILAIGFSACVGFFVVCLLTWQGYKKFKKWCKRDATQNLSAV